MASKKRQGKKNSGAGNPAKAAARGRSVFLIQAEQQINALRHDYTTWVAQQVPAFSPEQAAQAAGMQLDVIGQIAGQYAENARSSNLFDLDIDVFGETLAEHLGNLPESLAPEPIFTTWLEYFSFIEQRMLWQGPAENLEALREMLEDTLNGFAEGDAELCGLLRETKLFSQVKAYAQAVAEGVDMEDFSAAAEAPRAKVLTAVGLDAETFDPEGPAPLAFNYIWSAGRMSVVESEGSVLRTDPDAYELLVAGEEAGSAQLLFEMAVGCVQAHLNPTFDVTLRDEAHYLVLRNLLVTASTGREGDLEGLRRNCGPKIYDAVLPEARIAMDSLVGYGLISKDGERYSIDERLVPVISAGISEVEAFFEEAE
ncbi:hypothetical protein [Glutamicibacter sp. NPDC090743]|uniref:hypothetical protein n=1 Tax=Glutamicibacter sp. NPDC090743 TaxID=3364001 RepID=UPI0038034436